MTIDTFITLLIQELNANRQFGTSHIYKSTQASFQKYLSCRAVGFEELNQTMICQYELWLSDRGLSLNTISTYMRTLRAIYNKAIQAGIAPDVSFLFKKVYTGVESKVKRSISPVAVERLIHADRQQLSKKHAEACDLFALQFYLRGMPFVDLLQLKRSNLYGNLLCYHRRKTGRRIVVKLEVEAQKILNRYLSTSVGSPYIFPLYRDAQLKNANHYQAYQSSLRKYNDALFRLTLQLKLGVKLTSYTPRHTWATTAYHSKQPLGLISNALGHSSITVTEHYLRPFSDQELHLLNRRVIREVLTRN